MSPCGHSASLYGHVVLVFKSFPLSSNYASFRPHPLTGCFDSDLVFRPSVIIFYTSEVILHLRVYLASVVILNPRVIPYLLSFPRLLQPFSSTLICHLFGSYFPYHAPWSFCIPMRCFFLSFWIVLWSFCLCS